jgi:hypothetical protein
MTVQGDIHLYWCKYPCVGVKRIGTVAGGLSYSPVLFR